MPRCLPFICALILMLTALSAHAALKIEHSTPRRLDKVPFTRFSELFGCEKNTTPWKQTNDPTRVVIFSNPKERQGLYFDLGLNERISSIPPGSTALLEMYTNSDRTPRQFTFNIPATKSQAKVLYLGVTDEPFNKPKPQIPRLLAWKVTILDSSKQSLATWSSPLWSK